MQDAFDEYHLKTRVKVLGETFSIKERKLRTEGGIRFTNTSIYIFDLSSGHCTPEDGLISRKYIRVLSK
jgi:hypothetical protein